MLRRDPDTCNFAQQDPVDIVSAVADTVGEQSPLDTMRTDVL